MAYKVYKELERVIREKEVSMSVDKVLDVAKTVITIRIKMPENREVYTRTLFLTKSQKLIEPLFRLSQ